MATKTLFVQDEVEAGRLTIGWVQSKVNVADIATNHVDGKTLEALLKLLPVELRSDGVGGD